MAVMLDKTKDQRLVHSGMTWQQFKLLQESFADSPGIRLAYYKGEIEILTVSPEHESISRMIAFLLCQYFLAKNIEFNPLGSFTQEKGYEQIERSEILPNLDIDLLAHCVMMASKLEALKAFQQTIAQA